MTTPRRGLPSNLRFGVTPDPAGAPEPGDLCLGVTGGKLLTGPDTFRFPLVRDLPGDHDRVFVGEFDGRPVWAVEVTSDDLPGTFQPSSWRSVLAHTEGPYASIAARALQLISWRRNTRYCGSCAGPLTDVPDHPARRCASCERQVFPQLSPAVLVGISRPGEVLLVRHAVSPGGGWAVVAGFVEAGETLEDAVRREVWEEIGLELDDLRYFGSQPWAVTGPGGLLVGFLARWRAGEIAVDGTELAEGRWFPVDALPERIPAPFTMSRWLVDAVTAGG